MDVLNKGKAFLKQFIEGVVESYAFSASVKANNFVVKATAIPPQKQIKKENIKNDHISKYESKSSNTLNKIKHSNSDRHM